MEEIRSALIIDSRSADRERYHRWLAAAYPGDAVTLAASGSEGLAACLQSLPDLILLNFQLPDMTGLDFLDRLQAQNSAFDSCLPIVLLVEDKGVSAAELVQIAIAAVKQGAADCLLKSELTADRLRLTVDRILPSIQQSVQQSIQQSIQQSVQQSIPQSVQREDDRLPARPQRQHLTRQIAQQTAELTQIRQQLQQEAADRQQTELLLSRSEAEFRVLSEAAPIGIFRLDAMGNCTYVNPRAQAICGYTLEDAMGIGWQQSIHPADRAKQWSKWLTAMLANREYADEIRYVHKDGTVRFGRVRTAPIVSCGEIIGHVGTIEDITEAQEIEQVKREFLSIVSHELKTPLASIRGALALLSTGLLDDEPETGQEVLEIAISDTERLVRLVNDLLDLERLESRQIVLMRCWCDAATLMQRSIDSLQPLAEKEQIPLTFTPLSQQIYVDPDHLIQILVNLLGNAIKFSAPLQTVHLSASQVTIAGEAMLRFQVQDQGRGIPADKLTLIFERFQQVNAADGRQQDGTGLGLAICRSLVQLHGGQIWAESTLGKGSTFYFTLPLLPSDRK